MTVNRRMIPTHGKQSMLLHFTSQVLAKWSLCWIALLLVLSARSQVLPFRNYNVKNGLPQNNVQVVLQDDKHFIWLGTQDGFVRYDGLTFTTFRKRDGLLKDDVSAGFKDKQGNFWLGHRGGGLTYFDPIEQTAQTFTDTNLLQTIYAIQEDDNGLLYVGTKEGVYCKKDSLFQRLYLDTAYKAIDLLKDHRGGLWVGSEHGIYYVQSNQLSIFEGTEQFMVIDLYQDRFNNIWAATLNKGLFVLEWEEDVYRLRSFGLACFQDMAKTLAVQEDARGNLWVGTFQEGVVKVQYDQKSLSGVVKSMQQITTTQGLAYNDVYTLFLDHEGNMWFGTENNGVSILPFNAERFSMITKAEGLPSNTVRALFTVDQRLWVGTDHGLTQFRLLPGNNSFEPVFQNNYSKELISRSVQTLFISNETKPLWVGTLSGVQSISPSGAVQKVAKLKAAKTKGIASDKWGNVWVGTADGLFKYDVQTHQVDSIQLKVGAQKLHIVTMYVDSKQHIWIGTQKGGLFKITFVGKHHFDQEDNRGQSMAVQNYEVMSITEDALGQIWVATQQGGVFQYDKSTLHEIARFTLEDGLSSDNPYAVICDEDGMIWVGTSLGVDRLNPVTKQIQHYGLNDGFLGVENNRNAICKDTRGQLWFGTVNGVVRYNPSLDKDTAQIPQPEFSGMLVDYQPVSMLDGMALSYKDQYITFNFVAPCFSYPHKVQFQWKMVGYDKDWSPPATTRTITYAGLPPGKDYEFQVRAGLGNGHWSTVPVFHRFSISPPFWRTGWFIGLCGLLLTGITYFLTRLRLVHLANQKKEEFLNNLSHELRNPLNGIIGMASLIETDRLDNQQNRFLEAIHSSADYLMALINNFLDFSKIKAGKVDFEHIPFQLEEVLDQVVYLNQVMADEKNLILEHKIEEEVPEVLNGDPHRLQMILLNLVSNAIKFTEAGSVLISAKVLEKQQAKVVLAIDVADTGIGIPQDKLDHIFKAFEQAALNTSRKFGGTGLGLSIVKQLVILQGGDVKVSSETGKGSVFTITLPFEISQTQPVVLREASKTVLPKPNRHLKVLVVDDREINHNVVESHLAKWDTGITVMHAFNGKEAVKCVAEKPCDIVFMDVQMPVMDGIDATEQIRKTLPPPKNQVPIIAMTSGVTLDNEDFLKLSKMNDSISKPIQPERLLELIQKFALNGNGSSRPHHDELHTKAVSLDLRYVNMDYLVRLTENDPQEMLSFVTAFQRDMPNDISKIKQCYIDEEWYGFKASLHAMKNNTDYFGIEHLSQLIPSIEAAAQHAEHSKELELHLEELFAICETIDHELQHLQQYLQQLTQPL